MKTKHKPLKDCTVFLLLIITWFATPSILLMDYDIILPVVILIKLTVIWDDWIMNQASGLLFNYNLIESNKLQVAME